MQYCDGQKCQLQHGMQFLKHVTHHTESKSRHFTVLHARLSTAAATPSICQGRLPTCPGRSAVPLARINSSGSGWGRVEISDLGMQPYLDRCHGDDIYSRFRHSGHWQDCQWWKKLCLFSHQLRSSSVKTVKETSGPM